MKKERVPWGEKYGYIEANTYMARIVNDYRGAFDDSNFKSGNYYIPEEAQKLSRRFRAAHEENAMVIVVSSEKKFGKKERNKMLSAIRNHFVSEKLEGEVIL